MARSLDMLPYSRVAVTGMCDAAVWFSTEVTTSTGDISGAKYFATYESNRSLPGQLGAQACGVHQSLEQ